MSGEAEKQQAGGSKRQRGNRDSMSWSRGAAASFAWSGAQQEAGGITGRIPAASSRHVAAGVAVQRAETEREQSLLVRRGSPRAAESAD